MWSLPDIADALVEGVRDEAARLDEEQAVCGLDSGDELSLHPLLTAVLERAGYGVCREQRYPADRKKRRESEGERCDLVLTPDRRPLEQPSIQGTLFQPPDEIPLDEALWLEVKVVHQFLLEGPNSGYASQLLSVVRQDVTKLAKDDGILHAAVLIVLFTADRAVAEHDLGIWQDRCLERGLPISAPIVRDLPLTDRHGNSACRLAIYRVSHL